MMSLFDVLNNFIKNVMTTKSRDVSYMGLSAIPCLKPIYIGISRE